ncbi:MAG: bacillithiol biosynthesis cysteine-adding enzyme BshC [Bacteroidia bacterium]
MNFSTFPLADVPMLSKTDAAYSSQAEVLRPFYQYPVSMDSFAQIISEKAKHYSETQRACLVNTLTTQYQALNLSSKAQYQIKQLKQAQTFTVVTAHQPNLFLGPLYFIYKIASTIHLARKLAAAYPEQHFVPMFVMNVEDHDFSELNHATVFGKKIVWENEEKGAVGLMKTNTLQSALEQVKVLLGESENATTIFATLERCYTQYSDYQQATQAFIHELFAEEGLLVLNMNDKALKQSFLPLLISELFEQKTQELVQATQEKLQGLGFKTQAYPREINLFYLADQLRERIEWQETSSKFQVLNTEIAWTKEEMQAELQANPERFSPNVILRTLYQEYCLPNLAYIGGGGELAYWLEIKALFAHHALPFPMLIRRNSVLYLSKIIQEKLKKLSLTWQELMQDTDKLLKEYVAKHATVNLDFEQEKVNLNQLFEGLLPLVNQIDTSLEKTVLAEKTKQIQGFEALLGKIFKAEKQKNETSLTQIRNLQQKLFPGGGLQERIDNFLPFYLIYGKDFFTLLIDTLNPLDAELIVWEEE